MSTKELKKCKDNARKERARLKRAIWQYLIDHSYPYKKGKGYAIRFNIKDKREFFRRVRARELGKFKREDINEKKKEVLKYAYNYDKVQKRADRLSELSRNGGIHIKFLFWLKKRITLYLEKKSSKGNRT